MRWNNGELTVYHGTDSRSGYDIVNNGIKYRYFNPASDFGSGFYVTMSLHQAKNWANERVRTCGGGSFSAEVIEFKLDRRALESLSHLTFITDTQDYHDLVDYCWNGGTKHGPSRVSSYDVVYGPVSMHPQTIVLANCDQICFPDPLKMAAFPVDDPIRGFRQASPAPTIHQSLPNRYF